MHDQNHEHHTDQGKLRALVQQMIADSRTNPAPTLQHFSYLEGDARAIIEIAAEQAGDGEQLRQTIEAMLEGEPGVKRARVILTAHSAGSEGRANHQPDQARQRDKTQQPDTAQAAPKAAARPARRDRLFADIRYVIAVASGKGGVGKSTTAINLALAFRQMGLKAALLDADIYGPSLPILLGSHARPQRAGKDKITTIEAWGLHTMSIGFLIEEDMAMIWRGPMVQGALRQMMTQVAWPPVDVLVIDLPPGTGDVQLTLAQQVALSGAVVISTPQDLALADARKAITMFNRVEIPVLGLVENMAWFECPNCGTASYIFGKGGAESQAKRQKTPFLGRVPLEMVVRETSDQGTPIVAHQPDHPVARCYMEIAQATLKRLQKVKR